MDETNKSATAERLIESGEGVEVASTTATVKVILAALKNAKNLSEKVYEKEKIIQMRYEH